MGAWAVASDFSPELKTELAALLSALQATAARLAALLEDQAVEPTIWLSTSEAAELALIGSTQSVRNWARKYGLGLKVRNRWQIDRHLLEAFLRDRAPDDADAPPARAEHKRASLR